MPRNQLILPALVASTSLLLTVLVLAASPVTSAASAEEPLHPVQGGVIVREGPFVRSRTLFVTERARPTATLAASRRLVRPEDLFMLDGESESFQVAFRPDASGRVEARLAAGSDPWLVERVRFYRVLNVRVRTPSTGQRSSPGLYPDPTPPQVGAIGTFDAGDLLVDAGRTASLLVVVEDAPGHDPRRVFRGTIELVADGGRLIVRRPFSVRVGNVTALQPGDRLAFKVGAGFKPKWYQRGMPPVTSPEQQARQTSSLLQYLSRRFVSINNWEGDSPLRDGTYPQESLASIDAHTQLPWGIQFLPTWVGPRSLEHTRVADLPRVTALVRKLGLQWISRGFVARNPTWMYVYDEPDAPTQRAIVAPVASMVHRSLPGVQTFITGNPRRSTAQRRRCSRRPVTCTTLPARTDGNEYLWDGKGDNDLDAWAPLIYRQYGLVTTPRQARVGFNRSFDYSSPLRTAQARGAKTWTYSFHAGTDKVPTLAIDSPPIDPKVLTWQHAMAGRTGWYIWQFARWSRPVVGDDRHRDPWRDSLSIITRFQGWHGNGVASFLYPTNRPDLALDGADLAPVGSLRLEALRAGVEDYNLLAVYRRRFGEAAMQAQVRPLFGPLRPLGLSTGEMWPSYSTVGLAERMELRRRVMIRRLSSNM